MTNVVSVLNVKIAIAFRGYFTGSILAAMKAMRSYMRRDGTKFKITVTTSYTERTSSQRILELCCDQDPKNKRPCTIVVEAEGTFGMSRISSPPLELRDQWAMEDGEAKYCKEGECALIHFGLPAHSNASREERDRIREMMKHDNLDDTPKEICFEGTVLYQPEWSNKEKIKCEDGEDYMTASKRRKRSKFFDRKGHN